MSGCIKDLYNYDLVKKCSVCGILCSKSNFHEDNKRKYDVKRICRICIKEYHNNCTEQRNAIERRKKQISILYYFVI